MNISDKMIIILKDINKIKEMTKENSLETVREIEDIINKHTVRLCKESNRVALFNDYKGDVNINSLAHIYSDAFKNDPVNGCIDKFSMFSYNIFNKDIFNIFKNKILFVITRLVIDLLEDVAEVYPEYNDLDMVFISHITLLLYDNINIMIMSALIYIDTGYSDNDRMNKNIYDMVDIIQLNLQTSIRTTLLEDNNTVETISKSNDILKRIDSSLVSFWIDLAYTILLLLAYHQESILELKDIDQNFMKEED